MNKKERSFKYISLGTILALILTILTIGSFFLIIPLLTNTNSINEDISNFSTGVYESTNDLIKAFSTTPTTIPKNAVSVTTNNNTTIQNSSIPSNASFSLSLAGNIRFNQKTVERLQSQTPTLNLFKNVQNLYKADLSIATLCNTAIPNTPISDTNIPVSILKDIQSAGITMLNLNHYNPLSAGITGLAQTKNQIKQQGMTPYGLYSSPEERSTGTYQVIDGIKIAFLGFQNEMSTESKKQVSSQELDIISNSLTLPTIEKEIAQAKAQGAHIIVVSLSWGELSSTAPSNIQKELAQSIADAGADIIIGSHPNALQTVEILTAQRDDRMYHPVLCAYSLGNIYTHDRERRENLAGAILNLLVYYNFETNTISFDNLTYKPTYAWRGTNEQNNTIYSILPNQLPYPSFVDDSQSGVMARSYDTIKAVMENTDFIEN